jgi:STE24 endopeptidase
MVFAIAGWICAAGICAAQSSARPTPAAPATQAAAAQPSSTDAYTLPPGKLAQAKTLNTIRLTLEIVGTLWGLAVLWLLLATKAASGMEARLKGVSRFGWSQGLVFFAIFLIVTTVASLPLDAISHAASLYYGISVQKWWSWLGDQGKALAISLLFGAPVLLLFNWIVRISPRRCWLWAWIISLPLIVASAVLEPLVIEPLFNKYEPLMKTHAPLVAKLETVVARTGTEIPPERMFLMKASEKSTGINAYVTGLGASKRLVMWDTTTDHMPDDEILFIFGHESGHYVRNHIVKGLAITMASAFFLFWACVRFGEWLVRRFGPRWGIESVAGRAGFLTLIFAFSIVGFFITPAANTLSRHFEHEADVYGQEAIHGLVPDPQKTAVSAFNHLGEAWLEDPDPSPIVEFWDYNHPSVQNRAKFARQYDPWANGRHGRFFEK